jgi:hypothetical protein
MEFIPFFTSIGSANITPPNTFFKFLRSSFTDKATTPNYCTLAEAKLKEIGSTNALRLAAMGGSKEVNMLMAILAMAKIGSVLRTASDVDGVNSLGDGSTDAGFNACTNDDTNINNAEVLEVATGFGLFIENITSLLGNASNAQTALDAVSVVLNAICDITPASNCVALDTASIAPADQAELIDTYRDLLSTDTLGIGSCDLPGHPDLDTCCP